jgi:hypothetical protein
MMADAADITDYENFGIALKQQVTISIAALNTTKTVPSRIHSKAGKPVDAETLAKQWLIPANRAARTVDQTTQQGVCTCLNPTISCCFLTQQLHAMLPSYASPCIWQHDVC